LNVQPKGSAFYRSQLTREEWDLAVTPGPNGFPIVNYEATYPTDITTPTVWDREGKGGLPILNMVDINGDLVHSDINAIVAYGGVDYVMDGDGAFPVSTYPLESVGKRNPTVPNRLEPFREFTIAFHDEVGTTQAFPQWFNDPVFRHTLHSVRDSFMINYGSGGIGTEIIASRLGVGPSHDCVNCAYEEFFLTAFTVGDVGMLVDVPANRGLELCDPGLNNCAATGPKANYALYPDDPSNVHHSYTGDFTKFRNIHAGPGEQHIFHLHNHQWLFNANDDNSNYLDAQGIGPGSGYTYEINFGGSGNRNKTAGDAIFHCHFYPHFAQGMWEMWRIHDVLEEGTRLAVSGGATHADPFGLLNGTPANNEYIVDASLQTPTVNFETETRALPDGEIVVGTPIPAVVPLPGKPMAPLPADGVIVRAKDTLVDVKDVDGIVVGQQPVASLAHTDRSAGESNALGSDGLLGGGDDNNPGYPFWIAGIEHTVGQRPPTPPLDMITQTQANDLQMSGEARWQHPGFADPGAVHGWDGGLPRFTLEGKANGGETVFAVTRLDFTKEIEKAKPVFFPEEGTDLEQLAMDAHAKRCTSTAFPDGSPAACLSEDANEGGFILNGAPPVPGAPFNEPCVDDTGGLMKGPEGYFFDGNGGFGTRGSSPFNAVTPRVYKAANMQFDAVFNKLGYHYPQQRIIALWQDVVPTIEKTRPPEPFVIRMNTFDCTQYVHSNVVPKAYELDDYQVRTPTDIIGQHIHLPKWDLTTADGAANGWNYEDGTLSPEMVVEVIEAINRWNTEEVDQVLYDVNGDPVVDSLGHSLTETSLLEPANHPFFGSKEPMGADWSGARSTLQRWFADPVVNVQGVDRGLGIIFTHDHYGPSTHQQIGLYATVLVEPAGSKWVHNETGTELYTRIGTSAAADGGPTSWQAAILTGEKGIGGYSQNVGADLVESHREFYFEYGDFQHAYQPGVYIGAGPNGVPLAAYDTTDANHDGLIDAALTVGDQEAFRDSIQPSYRQQAPLSASGFPTDVWVFPPVCPGGVPRPCPEAISADDPGMYVINYRNESLTARVYDPDRMDCPDGKPGCQAKFRQGDLAFAMDSNVNRAIPELNDKLGLAPATYAGGQCNGVFCPPITDLNALIGGDPFTPTMRAVDGDLVHIKIQTGAHEEEHSFMIHGMKWLQSGSGFGEAKNSGWRNAQPSGISEQFTVRVPLRVVDNQAGPRVDYAYTSNASLDGYTSGNWGILRSTRDAPDNQLFPLPDNDFVAADKADIRDKNRWKGICPDGAGGVTAPLRTYDVTAVLANAVLDPAAGVTIQDLFPDSHMGRSPDPDGGTLVYNPRSTAIADPATVCGGGGACQGPLHDPTAILYVRTDDLVHLMDTDGDGIYDLGDLDEDGVYDQNGPNAEVWDDRCVRYEKKVKGDATLPTCPVVLKSTAPVEPLIIRAKAGECVEVNLRNKLLKQAVYDDGNGNMCVVYDDTDKPVFEDTGPDKYKGGNADCDGDGTYDYPNLSYYDVIFDEMPDLASSNAQVAMVRRDPGAGMAGMTSFNNNLMAPSPFAGLHAGLLEYDVTKHDGTNVGRNPYQLVGPGEQGLVRWYAGDIVPTMEIAAGKGNKPATRQWTLTPTPVEFGGFNLMPADKLKQGQKGMVGAGVIHTATTTWTEDSEDPMALRNTRTAATLSMDGKAVRDFTTVWQKGASLFYGDSHPVHNVAGEGAFAVSEDAQDMGHMAINYGTEPLWFRFGLRPCGEGTGCANVTDANRAYSNGLAGGDPVTPVFTAPAGDPFRMHLTMPFGPGRGTTYDLHGHVWQRDPYVCDSADLGLPGKCETGDGHAGRVGTGEVGSQFLAGLPGVANKEENPLGMSLGGIESVIAGEHYEIVIPSAGGSNAVPGDYLFRDHMGLGNVDGLWGIVRVE
jgi:hypothetical protein